MPPDQEVLPKMHADSKWLRIGVVLTALGVVPGYYQMYRAINPSDQTASISADPKPNDQTGKSPRGISMTPLSILSYASPVLGSAFILIAVILAFRKRDSTNSAASKLKILSARYGKAGGKRQEHYSVTPTAES
jgi:hypothetical protein